MMKNVPLAAHKPQQKILIAPEHDQFTVPAALREATAEWTNTHIVELPQVDHFIAVGARDACNSALDTVLSNL